MIHPQKFQSTLPAWGATFASQDIVYVCRISIHAPRVGSDRGHKRHAQGHPISIHAPRVGSDGRDSMPVLGGADFNPRSPRGERPGQRSCTLFWLRISIHAPRVGSDENLLLSATGSDDFNPRSPRGERLSVSYPSAVGVISIHAPRVGSDAHAVALADDVFQISIHAPRVGSDP